MDKIRIYVKFVDFLIYIREVTSEQSCGAGSSIKSLKLM